MSITSHLLCGEQLLFIRTMDFISKKPNSGSAHILFVNFEKDQEVQRSRRHLGSYCLVAKLVGVKPVQHIVNHQKLRSVRQTYTLQQLRFIHTCNFINLHNIPLQPRELRCHMSGARQMSVKASIFRASLFAIAEIATRLIGSLLSLLQFHLHVKLLF